MQFRMMIWMDAIIGTKGWIGGPFSFTRELALLGRTDNNSTTSNFKDVFLGLSRRSNLR